MEQVTRHITANGIAFESGSGRFELIRKTEALAEIVWSGIFDASACPAAKAYLAEFAAMSGALGRPIHMLHDLTGMTRYSRDILRCHSAYSLENAQTIGRIAVVSSDTLVYLGVTTVAVWQRRPIRSFPNHERALGWLTAAERVDVAPRGRPG